jgi:aspartyl-tRNA(Asn)/glutamyl-tRNA(Gln) amidotransferase subunit A
LDTYTVSELSASLRNKELSARELATHYLQRAREENEKYGAYLTVLEDEPVMKMADEAQAKLDAGDAPPLTGVPVAVKDNICTEGVKTTCASRMLENFVPPYDATASVKLKEAGAVFLGKTNLDEFAMGTSCENSAFFPARNPWDTERSPGGSSGGSSAAVAADLAPISIGSDTGGSIRMPAALCGVVGFKPTYGRVSRYGLVAFGSSLDQIGPIGQTVEDCALISEAISGHCGFDSTSLQEPPISTSELKSGSLKGLKAAVPKELLSEDIAAGVREQVLAALDKLRSEGVEISEISLPTIELGVSTYYIIAPAEASSNLARYDGVRYGPRIKGEGHIETVAKTRGQLFGREVKQRIIIGTYALSAGYYDAWYGNAQRVRRLMADEFTKAFQDYDFIVSPTSPSVAFKLGGMIDDPLALKLLDLCTLPANMGGFPAISLPCGFSEDLPVGLQMIGPILGDEKLLQSAYAVEQVVRPERRRPVQR